MENKESDVANTFVEYKNYAKDKLDIWIENTMTSFNRHPKRNGMNCGGHFLTSMGYAAKSLCATCIFTIHAFFPMFFETTGSDVISRLNNSLVEHSCLSKDDDIIEIEKDFDESAN